MRLTVRFLPTGSRRHHKWDRSGQASLEEAAGAALEGFGDLLRRSFGDEAAGGVAAFRAEVDDPVGRLDDVEVVLDDDHGLAAIDPAIEGKTWNHPVLVGDILLVRNGDEMAAFRLSLADR